jgi:phosphoribosyl-dephospho-CoA transferase
MRPHDLLRLTPGATLAPADAPTWVAAALTRAPFVVVRRAAVRGDWIAVGVRGESRAQRHPATLNVHDVVETITPEMLAHAHCWRSHPRRDMPAIAALDAVARAANSLRLAWGPGGSVGFELASGIPAVRADSDLDLIVRPTARHAHADLQRFRDEIDACGVRVDIAIEAAQGSVALNEWLTSPQRVLIKTVHGPQLGAFAW